VLVKPTKAGRDLFVRLTAEVKAMHRHQWAALNNDELKQLIHLLNKALWAGQQEPLLSAQGTKGTHP
jgi:DNA-binding MarR family transcriptional regulator